MDFWSLRRVLRMKLGDLSNEVAPAVGIRFEHVIRTGDGKLNRSAKAFLETLLRMDSNVYIITTGPERKAMSFLFKWAVPYTRVIEAESLIEIPLICNEHALLTYYDVDNDILQNVRARGKERTKAALWTAREVA